jgi:EAL domain-containing protein (putative c-di-GMP-specific phosphodiesterase class I)
MGKVAPYAFNKPLEDSGRIDELTWMMLRKAAACCRAWRAAGFETGVSVRLAVRSLADEGLSDRVTELVCGQDLEPRHMILEVAKSVVSTREGNALENLARLRMRGFGLSINDYGSGYSSLQQLTRIAFTELKVDQAFVRSAASDETSKGSLLSMLETARNLEIASVVEGVETRLDWDLLGTLGFDFAQGYFVAAPMDALAFTDWLKARR